MPNNILSLMILLPVFGALIQWFEKGRTPSLARWFAFLSSLLSSVCGVVLVCFFQRGNTEIQAKETHPWISSYAINYEIGVDGFNILLVLLIAVLFPILISVEWKRDRGARGFHALLLVLQSSLLGVLCSQDIFLMVFFWLLSSLPVYFLVGIWGGAKKEDAAFRTIVMSSIGNTFFFAALILIYYSIDPHSFSIAQLASGRLSEKTIVFGEHSLNISKISFLLISVAVLFRIPIWPLHSWFVSFVEEAPPAVVVSFCSGVIPTAVYIYFKLAYLLFPTSMLSYSDVVVWVGVLNMTMGFLSALGQNELRQLFAYLCLGGFGFVIMGFGSLNLVSVTGTLLYSVSFSLGLGGFGLLMGLLLERTGTTHFRPQGSPVRLMGVVSFAPEISIFTSIVIASLLGFPGFMGFVGYGLVMIGAFPGNPWAVLLSGVATLLSIYYLFSMFKIIFLGDSGGAHFPDLSFRERAYLFPIVVLLVVFGVYPHPLLELVRPTINTVLLLVK